MKRIKDYSLYLVTSEEYSKGKPSLEIVSSAIQGGVDIVQMREKTKSFEELVDLGRKITELCSENNVISIVNDDPILAEEVGSDGVHLGQEDIKKHPIEKVRKALGRKKIIGISTHSLDEFKKANQEDFDYIAFGPLFPTRTKDYWIGSKDIEKVLEIALKPVVFIGGINLDNIDEVLKLGAKNIAAIRSITQTGDITRRTRELKEKITGYKNDN